LIISVLLLDHGGDYEEFILPGHNAVTGGELSNEQAIDVRKKPGLNPRFTKTRHKRSWKKNLKVLVNRFLRRICGLKGEEVTGGRRKLQILSFILFT
jgi:hypothetical protein